MRSPKTLTLVESNPGGVDHYNVLAVEPGNPSHVLASKNYPVTGGTTVCPIGSDTFLQNIADGVSIEIHVIERSALGDGPDQTAAGGPFLVATYPDGVETITVQL